MVFQTIPSQMANFDYNQQNFWNAPPASQFPQQPQDFNFEMPDQFGQELYV